MRTISCNVGEENYNYQNLKMTIIECCSYNDITVAFENGCIRKHMNYGRFKEGKIKNYMIPTVLDVGIVGDVKTRIDGKHIKEYRTWINILRRCYDKNFLEKSPTYNGCTVDEQWKYFQNFYNWCHNQENWNVVENNQNIFHLDKDIIKKGNKIYSPDVCCFVPQSINCLFTKNNKKRGRLPIGVTRLPNGRYRSQKESGLLFNLGCSHVVDTPEKAFEIYKIEKEETIKIVAKREYALGNITEKCYNAMMNYQVEITD